MSLWRAKPTCSINMVHCIRIMVEPSLGKSTKTECVELGLAMSVKQPKGLPDRESNVWCEEPVSAMTASTQEGTYHPICGRSSDSPLFLTLLTFSSTKWTMVHESSVRRNTTLQSSIQRPDRPGIAPEFPVHPKSQLRDRITTNWMSV